jgi:hypothetical protein
METELLERVGGADDKVLTEELEPELATTVDKVESCVLNRSTGRMSLLPCSAFRAMAEKAPLASSMPALILFLGC